MFNLLYLSYSKCSLRYSSKRTNVRRNANLYIWTFCLYVLPILARFLFKNLALKLRNSGTVLLSISETEGCAACPCKERSICHDMDNDYKCLCFAGWKGEHCDESKLFIYSFIVFTFTDSVK